MFKLNDLFYIDFSDCDLSRESRKGLAEHCKRGKHIAYHVNEPIYA